MSENSWTREDLAKLKKGLAQAKAERKEVFKFENNDVLVSHVEQLVKVLEERFKKRR